jgi:peroxiredoxin
MKYFICMLMMVLGVSCQAKTDDPQLLLHKINSKVNALKYGSYVFHSMYTKSEPGTKPYNRDRVFAVSFEKSRDALVGFNVLSKGAGTERLYDGAFYFINKDSILLRQTQADAKDKVLQLRSDYTIFPLPVFLNGRIQSMNQPSSINQVRVSEKLKWHNMECYRLQLGESQGVKGGKAEAYIYVDAATLLPIGQYIMFETITGSATKTEIFDEYVENYSEAILPPNTFMLDNLSIYKRETSDASKVYGGGRTLSVGDEAPGWQLPMMDGKLLSLAGLRGKTIVVDFWFKDCSPCVLQMVELESLRKKYANKNIVFLGINIKDDNSSELEEFLQRRGINATIVMNGSAIRQPYRVSGAPVLYVIDKNGKIIYAQDGYSKDMKSKVEVLLLKNDSQAY